MSNLENTSPVLRTLVIIASAIMIIAGLRAAEQIIVPFLLAFLITLICTPLISWLRQRGLPGILAILTIVSLVLILGLLLGAIIGASLNQFLNDLPQYQVKLQQITSRLQTSLSQREVVFSGSHIQEYLDPGAVLKFAGGALTSLGNVMTNAFLILLTVTFMLSETVVFSRKLKALKGPASLTMTTFAKITDSINHYMAIKACLSLVTGLVITVWLWMIGVDYPILWGTIAFLLNFIPNFGSILAAIPAVLLALIQLGIPQALFAASGYVAVNVVIGSILEPRIMGRGLDLSALVVFLSLVFWGWVFGPVGMLLSVPLTMVVKLTLESFEETRWISVLLGSGDELEK